MRKLFYIILIFIFGIILFLAVGDSSLNVSEEVKTSINDAIIRNSNNNESNTSSNSIEVVAENLTIPWEVVFLPDDSMLVTERDGTLLRIDENTEIVQEIEGVEHVGEGGLLGMGLHPDFTENNWVYLYLTTRQSNGSLMNRVERYRFIDNQLQDREIILDNILGANYHDGGRIKFGPDGHLYITTGDAGNENLAQNTNSLSGKILRINDDGSIPSDNPFENAVYSYGHRNPQGLAWDGQNRLWATEHGPSGFQSGYDEVNLIEPGNNYGWPVIRGDEEREGMVPPVIQSGATDTWAPAGMEIINNKLFFAGLRGSSLYGADLEGADLTNLTRNLEDYGRLRAVVLGPDDNLYVTTSNTDGRGTSDDTDDKIIKIPPDTF